MPKTDPPTRIVPAPIGEGLAEQEEKTRALSRAELGLPADGDGLTLPRGADVTDLLPADNEGPTVQRPAPVTSMGADGEGPTIQRDVFGDFSDEPPAPSLVDDEAFPVHEGTALLPQSLLLKALALEPGELDKIIGSAPAPVPASTPDLVAPPAGRPWLFGVVVFMIALVLLGGAAFFFIWQRHI